MMIRQGNRRKKILDFSYKFFSNIYVIYVSTEAYTIINRLYYNKKYIFFL